MSNESFAPDGAKARRAVGDDRSGLGEPAGEGRSFSRVLGWTVLGAILPGLGLWRGGRKVVGGAVMSFFVLLLGGGAVLYLSNRRLVEDTVFAEGMLQALAVGLLLLAVLWVLVIGFSHLMLRPKDPSTSQRVAGAAVVGILSFLVAAPMAVGAGNAWTAGTVLDKVVGGDETPDSTQPTINPRDPWKDKRRLTFLIIGGDSGTDRPSSQGDRTDTVIVASIDTHTGATTLFTLPRNTERMPFPKGSPLLRYYPNGFSSAVPNPSRYERSQFLLNAMYRVVPTRVPHDILGRTKDFGASVMKVSVGAALGLKVDYFVKVNMDGFKDFVNAIGGITVNVNYKIPIGGQTDAHIPPDGYIQPGANQHLMGRLALWYARGRYGLDDYKRMERQRCVINAVVQQTTPDKVFTNFQAIAAAGEKSITTDVPRSLLTDLVELGGKVKGTKLRSVVFDPANGFSSPEPDWPAVRKKVRKALKETEFDAVASPAPVPTSAGSGSPTASAAPTVGSTTKPKSDDLARICGYHPEEG